MRFVACRLFFCSLMLVVACQWMSVAVMCWLQMVVKVTLFDYPGSSFVLKEGRV